FQAEDGIRDLIVTGVQTCALPICPRSDFASAVITSLYGLGVPGLRASFGLLGEPVASFAAGAFSGGLGAGVGDGTGAGAGAGGEIGRASCRERGERREGGGGLRRE